jgi:hypothetical protein
VKVIVPGERADADIADHDGGCAGAALPSVVHDPAHRRRDATDPGPDHLFDLRAVPVEQFLHAGAGVVGAGAGRHDDHRLAAQFPFVDALAEG